MEDAAKKVNEQVASLSNSVGALQSIVREFMSGPALHGMRLLDVKSASMMRYVAALCRYGAARVARESDQSVEDAVAELVREWVAIERTRPLEKAMRPRVNALLERASRPRVISEKGKLAARPDPGNLVADDDDDGTCLAAADVGEADNGEAMGKEGDIYRPPRIAEVLYDGEREAIDAREAKTREKMTARAARSRSVREMLAEVSGKPDELRDEDGDERLRECGVKKRIERSMRRKT
jgi:U3 small nucleolar ribonucleoprotein protein LCP5